MEPIPASSTAAGATTTVSATLSHGPADDARALLAQAAAATDPSEQCRLVHAATLADPTSIDARRAYAGTRCASAKALLDDARFVFEKQPDVASASLLATVASRAGDAKEALRGAAWLDVNAGNDLDGLRLAAATAARFGEHEHAAALFTRIAEARESKGSTLDAIDARLDAAMEVAQAGANVVAKEAMRAVIARVAKLEGDYGEAWVGGKIVEGIATLRALDEAAAAQIAKEARALTKVFGASALRMLDMERAIATARATKSRAPLAPFVAAERKASRDEVASARALLAVDAKLAGSCAGARAYGRAHAWIVQSDPRGDFPHFDDDVAWAIDCGSAKAAPTIAPPPPPDDVADADAVAATVPSAGRLLLDAIVDARPDDVAARIALARASNSDAAKAILDAAIVVSPREPWLHFMRWSYLVDAKARIDEANKMLQTILPVAVEVQDDPRAAARMVARVISTDDGKIASDDFAEALVEWCGGAQKAPKCGVDESLGAAVRMLRVDRPAALVKHAASIVDADLAIGHVRLDVVEAFLLEKKPLLAEATASAQHGPWSTDDAKVARAMIYAAAQKCDAAKSTIAQSSNLAASFPDEAAFVAARCK